jgi:plasmid stabilization system protein ParE
VPRLRILPEALGALIKQAAYYEKKKTPATAERWEDQALATCHYLAENPWIGLRWRFRGIPDARVATVQGFKRFVVVYREDGDDIVVLDFVRATRDMTRRLDRGPPDAG